ncbi:MAG: RIP metalloprotease RseP [Bacteroidetes bacterium]|nr:RIP metalloprotease RseP [Bacteroidota bacterium]
MGIVTQILGLVLSLAILILLHEAGHFVFAKLFNTRVEKFYLFFNPWFSLFKIKKGETEYGIGWLPLGGYVKIAGMIDESLDKEALKKPPQPWEFRSKPAWQRLFIMLGGVVVNFLLALFIYSMVLFAWGEEYIPMKNMKYGVYCDSLALDIGLRHGDKILKVDTFTIDRIQEVIIHLLLDNPKTISVERDNRIVKIEIPEEFHQTLMRAGIRTFIDMRVPYVIDSVLPGQAADSAGIRKYDSIIGINRKATPFFNDFRDEIGKHTGKYINLSIVRDDSVITVSVRVSESGKIGVFNKSLSDIFETRRIEYGFFESFPAGIGHGVETLGDYVKQFKLVFTREGAKQLGGFGTIGRLFPEVWDWRVFWYTTALLSIILAFMNILPIPALDGGHVFFLLIEMVTRRKPGDKFMERAQIAGMIILLALLLYANGNDILRGCSG